MNDADRKGGSKRRLSTFGPGGSLIGAIVDSAGAASSTGAVLWGLGVAELKTARRLAAHGIPALQARVGGDAFTNLAARIEIYRSHGIEYCRAAMDHLAAQRGSETFLLMGNCATANMCFATALKDSRVSGLILTNPHVSSLDIPRTSLLRKTLRLQTWRRALTGRLKWQHVAAAARLPQQGASLPTARDYDDPSQGLPHDLGDLVRRLCARDVYILMVCADGDDSLSVMRARHGATLRDAQHDPRFTFATVEADSHVFSTDDAAAGLLNETISAWIENVFLPATARVRGAA